MKIKHLIPLLLLMLVSCSKSGRFKVEGVVKDAKDQVLYFEQTGLVNTVVLDSVKLNEEGRFRFKSKSPEYPEFYRLRINDRFINFAVDSTENIKFEAEYNNFSTGYKVEGSLQSELIQRLRLSVSNIQRKANMLKPGLSEDQRSVLLNDIENDIEAHKVVARKLILENPRSTSAYYAIYQQIGNAYIFSPYIGEDKPYCAAVATSWNTFVPENQRTKNLYNLVMDAIKLERKTKQNQAWRDIIETTGTGYIDIELTDKNGTVQRLSSLEGNVILVDFSAYESERSVQYTFELRELYNKYHNKGFEIYQVSVDRNKLLWESSVENIPWICVLDAEQKSALNYNISSVPTTFLINRKGEIVGRSFDFKTLDKEIQKSL